MAAIKAGQAITTINGDLTINIDRQNDLSANYYQASPRYESVAGIVNNEADGSIVNVNGMVDMNIAGSGVIVDSWYDSNNEVNIKGGRIVINNDGNLALGNNHALTHTAAQSTWAWLWTQLKHRLKAKQLCSPAAAW